METTNSHARTAIVTGAASGIGQATATFLGQTEAQVVLVDRDATGLSETADQVREAGGRCSSFTFDLMRWMDIPELVKDILAAVGPVHILVNSAGISDQGKGLFEVEDEVWDRVHTIDLRSPFILLREVARHMIERGGGGKIVNVSSSSAYRRDLVSPVYGSAKAGLDLITRSAAGELGVHDINVNSVVPGYTRTPMNGLFNENLVKEGPLANMLHRASQPEDVASVIVFLCSPASRQITGQMIHTSAGNIV